jgi:ribosomal protein L40E
MRIVQWRGLHTFFDAKMDRSMALKPCRECGQQVSTEAETCPHCGVRSPTVTPLSDSASKKRASPTALLVFLILISIGLWVFGKSEGPQETSTATHSGSEDQSKPAESKPASPATAETAPAHKEVDRSWTSISKFRDKDGFVTIVDATHETVVIFKSTADAMRASNYSKANPDLKVIDVMELVACIVDSGTRAMVDGSDYPAIKITIADGKSRGCHGVVLTSQLQLPK